MVTEKWKILIPEEDNLIPEEAPQECSCLLLLPLYEKWNVSSFSWAGFHPGFKGFIGGFLQRKYIQELQHRLYPGLFSSAKGFKPSRIVVEHFYVNDEHLTDRASCTRNWEHVFAWFAPAEKGVLHNLSAICVFVVVRGKLSLPQCFGRARLRGPGHAPALRPCVMRQQVAQADVEGATSLAQPHPLAWQCATEWGYLCPSMHSGLIPRVPGRWEEVVLR